MTSGAHTIDVNTNLKAQIDSLGPGLSFGYFEILLACIVIEIIASFWENSLLLKKWPFLTPCDLNFDLIKKWSVCFL